jgi:hypothetical protein
MLKIVCILGAVCLAYIIFAIVVQKVLDFFKHGG